VLRPRLAVLWAAFFNFIAFAFFGTKVANTVGQTVKPGYASVAVIFAALTGAILWNYLTWWLRLPTDMASCPQDKKSAGGPGSIAEQQVDHHVDVLLGGGRQRFDQTIDGGPDSGQTVVASAQRQGYQLEWTGELATPDPGSGPQRCVEGQRPAAQPSLAAMTTKAISLLEAGAKGRRHGFFLQVEGASIDKQDHAENPRGQIGETVAFDRVIAVGLGYAKRHPDTLVVVTADHGHTSQIIEPQTATDHSPGAISTLVTADGAEMVVNYATNLDGRSQSHTGTQVRIAAQGPQAANVAGVTDQTDLFHTMARALGLPS
jgi:alkaline phosphatase